MPKGFKKTQYLAAIAGKILAIYIRFVYRTSSVTFSPHDAQDVVLKHMPSIMGVWHGQFMLSATVNPKEQNVKAMLARHKDAELIGHALKSQGVQLVRGAGAGDRKKDRGGAYALRACVKALEEGYSIVMTGDVPPGPARISGQGIITMSKLSGRPILPVAVATSRFMTFNTWSRFTLNLPFSKMACVVGDPIYVSSDATQDESERLRLRFEVALNKATEEAYKLAGGNIIKITPSACLPDNVQLKRGVTLKAYKVFSSLLRPVVPFILSKREKRGKEDPLRIHERFGKTSVKRPVGPLMWFHAASVGETNAILPLMKELQLQYPHISQLLTTATITSAKLAAKRLPKGAIHQFVPVDVPEYVNQFLDHWHPDIVFFVESEIWPNLLMETGSRHIPIILINGIMSEKSFKSWRKKSTSSRILFSQFKMTLVQNKKLAKRFDRLGSRKTHVVGNLKIDVPSLPVDLKELEALKSSIGMRPVFLAASTHAGEEEIICQAHKMMREKIPNLLTIIIPRHPERAHDIRSMLTSLGVNITLRTSKALPDENCDIYLADTIGETGLFYSLAPITFIGGSLISHGGHNPIEAIKLNSVVLTGPYWHNIKDIYQNLIPAGGALEVSTPSELSQAVLNLFANEDHLKLTLKKGQNSISDLSGALDKTLELIAPYIPQQRDITGPEFAA